jgi:outer membrane receptor for ferrienterochelin and colicins
MWMFKKFTILPLALAFSFYASPLSAQDTATAKQLDEVVVTGQYAPQSLKNSVYRVRVIKQEQIKLRGATDVAGVLSNELGVRFSTDFALGESDISIMGMSGQNVKVLLDGVPVVDRGEIKQSLNQLDINSIERIEIVEGPMSVVYGTDALAGVINIITKKTKRGNNVSIAARIQEESAGDYYSPFANEGVHNENLSINWQKNNWYVAGYGTRNTFGGWIGKAVFPAKEFKPKDQYFTGGTLGYHTTKLNTWYRLDYLDEDIQVPGTINLNNYKAKDQNFKTQRYTHQLQAEWQASKNVKINGAASYQDYTRRTETVIVDYNNGAKTPSENAGEWDVAKFKTAFVRGTAQWYISPVITLQPGFEIKSDKTSGERVAGNPTINDYSVFVSAEIKAASFLTVRPGLRFSKNSIYDAPPVIPSVNAKIALTKEVDVRASYARGFRAPSLRELYFYFFDASHSIEGNPNLKAEYSNSFMASVNWSPVHTKELNYNTSLSGFYNDFNNRIDLAQGANSVYTYINISKYKTTGVIFDNSFSYNNLTLTAGASYIGRYNVYFDDPVYKQNKQTKFTWSPEVNSTVAYRFTKLKATAALFYKFTGTLPQYQLGVDPNTNQEVIYLGKIGSYHLADLTASKTIFKYITLQAGIKNLFDVTRINNNSEGGAHSGGGGPVLTAYGRSYFAGITFQWSKN